MRIRYERKYFKYSVYVFLVIAASILVYKALDNANHIRNFIGFVGSLLMPFIIGYVIAYFCNPPVKWIETRLLKNIKKNAKYSKRRRGLSILLVYVIFLGVLSLILTQVVPTIIKSSVELVSGIPDYLLEMQNFMDDLTSKYDFTYAQEFFEYFDTQAEAFLKQFDFQNVERFLGSVMKGVFNITTVILDFFLGLIIGFYFLMEKEVFIASIKRFLRVMFKDETAKGLIEFGIEVDYIFSKFIIGKSIDSLIIGILCFIGLTIMNIKYAAIISLIIGITNMIPYFGPFIGGVPAFIITLFNAPIKALWVAIFVFILQQFDGMVLGPKILGESTGLNPVWIIFAILVGGGFFGIVGMFLGVPVVAVLRLLLVRFMDKKMKEKEMNA
ncbi:MAG: AI-2E family transporter [Firmicutes bacterium]|nr:AI-2E family transporter [Bacillota bacterium]